MQIAIPLFDHFTALDAVGPYEVLSRLPGVDVVFVAAQKGPVTNETGSLQLVATHTYEEVSRPDVVIVPGGPGQRDQMTDAAMHTWLRSVDETSTWTASVCTGSLILAAAGLLSGRRTASHWLALDQLPALGAVPARERVVFDGKYVTAAGVSSGIDMGLALAGRIAGDTVAQMIQLGVEYDPQPPYDAGSEETAGEDVVGAVRALKDMILGGPPVRVAVPSR